LFLVATDFHFFDGWREATWDPKSSNGMVAIVLVSLPVEWWCLLNLFRSRLTLRGAARWVLTNAAAAFAVGTGLVAILASPLLDSLRTVYLVCFAFLLELVGASALVAWLWRRRSISREAHDEHSWRQAFVRFALSSTLSAAVAVAVGWSWHLAYDWWAARQCVSG
jgi:hypothetical protein